MNTLKWSKSITSCVLLSRFRIIRQSCLAQGHTVPQTATRNVRCRRMQHTYSEHASVRFSPWQLRVWTLQQSRLMLTSDHSASHTCQTSEDQRRLHGSARQVQSPWDHIELTALSCCKGNLITRLSQLVANETVCSSNGATSGHGLNAALGQNRAMRSVGS